MTAKIIVFEGLDCSFKETNSKRLKEKLKEKGFSVYLHSFPSYNRESSYFVRKYLSGAYGNPTKLDPVLSSFFYALDRYDTFEQEVSRDVDYIIFDRYAGSNLIYQGAKFGTRAELSQFITYMHLIEYNVFKMPEANLTLFMDVPYKISRKLMEEKPNRDAHESNEEYQKRVYETADIVAAKEDWVYVKCYEGDTLLNEDAVFNNVWSIVKAHEGIED